ncbi:MAG: hypothetical protein ACYTDY_13905 [Planctomycetota bacterium]
MAARAYWRICHGVPFFKPSRILHSYYPELQRVETERPSRDDGFYDILLLGGSALHREWSSIEQGLEEQLARNGRRNVRVFNLAMPAHTSRDSWLKYAALDEARFELVVFYHGINEARANNAPPELFREDYAHYFWYEAVNTLAPYHGEASFALSYTLRYIVIRARYVLQSDRYILTHHPRQDWMDYGGDSRSAASFRENLSAILDLAAQRGDQMLLMTFSTYVPGDYSLEAFKAKRLDYGLHICPIEIWGRPEHVMASVDAHNEVVRSLASQHDGVVFVDQANLMTGSARYFNDSCHFTLDGSSKFVEYLVRGLLRDP